MKPRASSVVAEAVHRRRGERCGRRAVAGGAATRRRGRGASAAARETRAGAARTAAPTRSPTSTAIVGVVELDAARRLLARDDRAASPRAPSPVQQRRARSRRRRTRRRPGRSLRRRAAAGTSPAPARRWWCSQPAMRTSLADVRGELRRQRPFHPRPPSGSVPDVRARGARGATALRRRRSPTSLGSCSEGVTPRRRRSNGTPGPCADRRDFRSAVRRVERGVGPVTVAVRAVCVTGQVPGDLCGDANRRWAPALPVAILHVHHHSSDSGSRCNHTMRRHPIEARRGAGGDCTRTGRK